MDEIKAYVRDVLSHIGAGQAAEEVARTRLEAEGYRIINGGSVNSSGAWEITDDRSGKVLASGTEGLAEYERAAEALNSEHPIWHRDKILSDRDYQEYAESPSPPPSIPDSLARVLDEWADSHQDEAWEWASNGLDRLE